MQDRINNRLCPRLAALGFFRPSISTGMSGRPKLDVLCVWRLERPLSNGHSLRRQGRDVKTEQQVREFKSESSDLFHQFEPCCRDCSTKEPIKVAMNPMDSPYGRALQRSSLDQQQTAQRRAIEQLPLSQGAQLQGQSVQSIMDEEQARRAAALGLHTNHGLLSSLGGLSGRLNPGADYRSAIQLADTDAAALQRLERVLAAQAAMSFANSPVPLRDDAVSLERALLAAQSASSQHRSSLESAIRLKRLKELEELRIHEALYGSAASAPGNANMFASLPRFIHDQANARLLQMSQSLSGGLSNSRADSSATYPLLGRAKRKPDNDELASSTKKRKSQLPSSNSFPLPLVKGPSADRTSAKLESYHRLWNQLSGSKMQSEVFRRRIHQNRVKLVGGTRSALRENDEKEGGKEEA